MYSPGLGILGMGLGVAGAGAGIGYAVSKFSKPISKIL